SIVAGRGGGLAEDLHLTGDRGQCGVRVDIPWDSPPRGATDRCVGVGSDPHRWMRLLQWKRRDACLVQGPPRCPAGHRTTLPECQQYRHQRLEPADTFGARGAEGLILDV